jgi:mannose-6-phosphate isomerase
VQAGDCFVVPAGTPHAIGAGVFMVELMEPTDWVVRCEATNGGVTLTPDQCFMGLGLESCLDIFDYRAYSAAEVRQMFGQVPRTLRQGTAFTEEEIIRSPWHSFFRLHRLRGNGAADWSGGEMILLIAVTGRGRLGTAGASVAVSAGETWLLPGAAESWDWQPDSGPWEILLAKLPVSTGHRIH